MVVHVSRRPGVGAQIVGRYFSGGWAALRAVDVCFRCIVERRLRFLSLKRRHGNASHRRWVDSENRCFKGAPHPTHSSRAFLDILEAQGSASRNCRTDYPKRVCNERFEAFEGGHGLDRFKRLRGHLAHGIGAGNRPVADSQRVAEPSGAAARDLMKYSHWPAVHQLCLLRQGSKD